MFKQNSLHHRLIRRTSVLLLLAATTTTSLAQHASQATANRSADVADPGGEQIRVYDLRDMMAELSSAHSHGSPEVSGLAATRTIVSLARLMNMRSEPLSEGVFAIGGPASAQEQFEQTIASLRGLDDDRFLIDFRVVTVTGGALPEVGSTVRLDTAGTVNARVLSAVEERSNTSFSVITETSYIAGWMPVVSGSVIGYQSNVKEVPSGLEADIAIDDSSETGVTLSLRGGISEVEIVERTEALAGDGLTIGLPIIEKRTFTSGVRAEFGTATVVASMTGFEPGEHIIAIVIVEPLD